VVKLSRILKDYRRTGALCERIGLFGFVDDRTFPTKSGVGGGGGALMSVLVLDLPRRPENGGGTVKKEREIAADLLRP
jgi:hypothetical protein